MWKYYVKYVGNIYSEFEIIKRSQKTHRWLLLCYSYVKPQELDTLKCVIYSLLVCDNAMSKTGKRSVNSRTSKKPTWVDFIKCKMISLTLTLSRLISFEYHTRLVIRSRNVNHKEKVNFSVRFINDCVVKFIETSTVLKTRTNRIHYYWDAICVLERDLVLSLTLKVQL